MGFDESGKRVSIKDIKSSQKYKTQHEKAVKMVEKYNTEHYKGSLNLSKCRAILQLRHQDAKVEMAIRKNQEV